MERIFTFGSSVLDVNPTKQHLEKDVTDAIYRLALQFKRDRQTTSSQESSIQTARALLNVIMEAKFQTIQELLILCKINGKKLTDARPLLVTIGNTVRRICAIIRNAQDNTNVTDDLGPILDIFSREGGPCNPHPAPKVIRDQQALLMRIQAEVHDYIEEIQTVYSAIAGQAVEHVHSNEVILTYARSKTAKHFIEAAAKFRKLTVIVPEGAPDFRGQQMATQLNGGANLEITVISDASIFALMPRINKVIIGCFSVMANGGILGPSGVHTLCLAAKHYSIPVVVVVGVYKISPLFAFDQDTFNEHRDPQQVLPFHEARYLNTVDVINPAYDYVPPHLIDLMVTNYGGHSPNYIYRLLKQHYHQDDYDLEIKEKPQPWYSPKGPSKSISPKLLLDQFSI